MKRRKYTFIKQSFSKSGPSVNSVEITSTSVLWKCHLKFACKSRLEEHCLTGRVTMDMFTIFKVSFFPAHQTNIKVDRTCPKCQNVIRGLNDYFRHVEKDHRFVCSMCTLFAYNLKFEEHLPQVCMEEKIAKLIPRLSLN